MTTLEIQSDDVESGAPAKRAYTRRAARTEAAREPARDPNRGNAVVHGRNGEVLSRTQTDVVDVFELTADMQEPGWDRQWNTYLVKNSPDECAQHLLEMHANGWRPITHDRFPGKYAPHGATGAIIVKGMRLEERPLALSQEARRDELRKASKQMSDRNEALKLGQTGAQMPRGFEMNQRYRGTGGNIKMSIDPALDIPMPAHEIVGPGE